ncbi:tRNA (pseudouridine-N1)-methyltransferase [Nanobdella aerobiophila]|uniref:tRNA (Pseudouridine-N1)-methyltransferase n=1 Tax=Nanobdella aerobiophila TaxID=2586965 RepID=A0A915WRH5_9ARCH|nr:hypothetical protein [Nanobdella aerobiophila]BBL45249.1 tRNA (pseudouridine-N1)-methyltransferase [Nanobdella aerobiophila]
MRNFIFYSNTININGNFNDIHTNRIDIAINSIIHAFFISNGIRKHINFNLFINNSDYRLIKIESNINTPWSKKDILKLLSLSLIKFNKKKIKNPFPGIYVDKIRFIDLLNSYKENNIYLLDRKGEYIEDVEIKNPVFIIGDFLGIPKEIKKEIKDMVIQISLGDINYFSSQVIMILNYYLDRMDYYKDYWDTSYKFKYG